MNIHLFGSSTPVGEAFRLHVASQSQDLTLFAYSRSDSTLFFADFSHPTTFSPGGNPAAPSLIISFAPIWLFVPFLQSLLSDYPERFSGIRGVIVCSSTSASTKRYSVNSFDRNLVARLTEAEDSLISICGDLNVFCRIIRTSMIYGRVGTYHDLNVSKLVGLLRSLPIFPLPDTAGLRQPIHACQLAEVVFEFVTQYRSASWDHLSPKVLAIGGDIELNYIDMLRQLQLSLPSRDPACSCFFLLIPTRLFYFFASPLILFSPKLFEAVFRISADLSGFTPAHTLLGTSPRPFPVKPFV